jgi:DNA-binding LacI/PurR family transcriptional regulator
MRGSKSNLIGIIVGDITNTFFTKLLDGIEEIVNKESMAIVIGNSSESLEKEQKNVDAFLSYHCSGIAISPVAFDFEIIKKLREENVNFVVLDRPSLTDIKCDQVSINNEGDSIRAVEYLLVCGHKKIGIINSQSSLKTEQDRNLGYKKALSKYNIEENSELIKICNSKEDAYTACCELLLPANRPTAIYIAKESLGLGVISAIMNMGLKIPDDISVIIYGDPEWASIFRPTFTCMQRPVKEMGKLGASILINKTKNEEAKIENSENYKNIKLDSQLIIRESVRII